METQNVDDMGRRYLKVLVSYNSEDSDTNVTQTKKELREEEKRVIEYLRELIESDFHERYKLKVKKIKEESHIDFPKDNYPCGSILENYT